MSLIVDTRRLESVAMEIELIVGRSCVESLNRAAKHVIIGSKGKKGAAQLSPKAKRIEIARVPAQKIRGFLIKKLKAAGRWPVSTSELNDLVIKERQRRLRGVGYLAYAGWQKALIAVGGQGFGKGINKEFSKSQAAQGSGRKATKTSLLSEVINTAQASERLGYAALEAAVDNAEKDLTEYLVKKISTRP